MMELRWWRVDASEVAAVTAMGVWEAVLASGGRRFLKRKDSDAGETGSYSYRIVPSIARSISFLTKLLRVCWVLRGNPTFCAVLAFVRFGSSVFFSAFQETRSFRPVWCIFW
jgi:hypothetical protein